MCHILFYVNNALIQALKNYQAFDEKIQHLDSVDWAIFISSNAVQNSLPRLIQQLGHIPPNLKFAAIGPKTAADLAEFGVQNTLTPQDRFDSEALLALPEMQAIKNQKVMIFRGIGGREVLAETLKQRGATVDFAESYQRVNPQKDLTVLETLLAKKQLDAIVVTSSEAIEFKGEEGFNEPAALRPRAVVPLIDILKPETGPDNKLKAPFPITVAFKGQSDAPIDPSTFKVLYGALKIDITSRITKFVKVGKDGFTLDNAQIPQGKHRLTLQVQDEKQRTAERELRVEVE